jgi:hypothetical protein
MRFEITTAVHFGYMRTPGVYDDMTEADAANLSAPRAGLPHGYGRAVAEENSPVVAPVVAPLQPAVEDTNDETTAEKSEPPSSGTGSNDPATGSSNTDPKQPAEFTCPTCSKSFTESADPAVSLSGHRRSKKH